MSRATQENIRRLLDITGTTHQQMADIAGVDRSAVSHWKSGKAEPRMGHLQRIADHFGIKVSNLSDPNGMKYVHRGADGKLHDDARARLIDLRESILSLDDQSPAEDMLGFAISLQNIPSESFRLSKDEVELLDMYRSLNEAGREMALSVVASFVKSGSYV